MFFIIPCMDDLVKKDLRTISFDVPPQEVCILHIMMSINYDILVQRRRVLNRESESVQLSAFIHCVKLVCTKLYFMGVECILLLLITYMLYWQILTKDSVTIAVDAVVYYRINNPMLSVIKVEDASRSTRLLAQTTLRNILGTKTLAEILSEREGISTMMQVTHIMLPQDLPQNLCHCLCQGLAGLVSCSSFLSLSKMEFCP